MAVISLTLNNRTQLDLMFTYNEMKYEVAVGRQKTIRVEPGHRITVYPPDGARATRNKRFVEYEYHIYELQENSLVDCTLVGWQLDLRVRPDII